jgi:hypothetical protein
MAQIISLTCFFANQKSNSFLGQDGTRVSRSFFQSLASEYTGFNAGADRKSAIITFTAVLDPVSFQTQKIVSLLNVILALSYLLGYALCPRDIF